MGSHGSMRGAQLMRVPTAKLHELQIDRTSCSDFWANQFRVLLTAAAYVLLQSCVCGPQAPICARAQVWTLRERLLKLGARVLVSVRRWWCTYLHPFRFFPPSGQWRWHWERRPDNTGPRLPQNFPSHPTATTYEKNPVRKRCRANFYTPTSQPAPSDNQNHPHALCSA